MIATEAIFLLPWCFESLFLLYIADSFSKKGALYALWRALLFLRSQQAQYVPAEELRRIRSSVEFSLQDVIFIIIC